MLDEEILLKERNYPRGLEYVAVSGFLCYCPALIAEISILLSIITQACSTHWISHSTSL